MLGLSRREARARFDEIIEFAELEEFVDLKLKNYSSGMSVRLGFSVAIQVEAEVLLVDEVLAVGDAAFQQKCFDEFDRLKSREPDDALRHARHGERRALLRPRPRARARATGRRGRARARSPRTYNEINFGQMSGGERPGRRPAAPCASCAAGARLRIGERVVSSRQGEDIHACFEVEFVRGRRGPGAHGRLPQRGAAHDPRRRAPSGDGGRFEPATARSRASPSRTCSPRAGTRSPRVVGAGERTASTARRRTSSR